jgi:predicted membrane-bound mannosyltransferase
MLSTATAGQRRTVILYAHAWHAMTSNPVLALTQMKSAPFNARWEKSWTKKIVNATNAGSSHAWQVIDGIPNSVIVHPPVT